MRLLPKGRAMLLATALAAAAQAQTPSFQLLVSQSSGATTIQNGGVVTFVSTVGQNQTAEMKATFNGPGTATFSQQPSLLGSTAFNATLPAMLPVTLAAGQSIFIEIQFLPTNSQLTTALLNVPYSLTAPPPAGGIPTTTAGSITASLSGTVPSFVQSYVLLGDQNVIFLQPGGTISFPATVVAGTAQATLNLINAGSGPGTVNGVAITGNGFRLTNVPLFPASVDAGKSVVMQVLYQPTGVNSDTGQITINYSTGPPVIINLQGTGASSKLSYQLLTNPVTTVAAGGTISLPDTNLGQSSSVVVRVLNTGSAAGAVNSVSLAGQGYQIAGVPQFPLILAPNASLTFTVIFSPTQVGTITGTLVINSDLLNLSGVALGAQLQFSYSAGGTTVTLSSTGSVIFSPVTITQSAQLSFDVKNIGTVAANVFSIGIGQTNSPFSVSGLPPLPLRLGPGADSRFTISFVPTVMGFSNGTLLLDTTTIPLVGSGTQPPALPAYSFSGPSGTVAPGSQPTVSLTLANSYPVALTGGLTLTTLGNLPADPAVQFASGGRTVAFVIPANTTSAVFGAQGKQLGLQTGTVADSYIITPSFATQAGGINLTPDTPPTLQFSIAGAAPTLTSIHLNGAASSIGISVTGFSTTRTLRVLSVQFGIKSGFTMPTSQFNVDVSQAANSWFTGTASQTFGGQFTLTVPFTFTGTVPAGQTLLNGISSVTVSLSNDTGTSNSLQATLQ